MHAPLPRSAITALSLLFSIGAVLCLAPSTAQALVCGTGTDIGGGCRVFLTSGTSWSIPSDWNSASNTIEVIGGGGGGHVTDGSSLNGGGGGAYSKISNLSLTPSGSAVYQVGSAGTGSSPGTAGADTFFNRTAGSANTCADTTSVCAKGGGGGADGAPGAGGAAASGTGTTKFSGGTASSSSSGGSGGGGAAGPNGAGAASGKATSVGTTGGGGNGGGSASASNSAQAGGAGGNNSSGAGSGAGGPVGTNGTAGVSGGGGGGGGLSNTFGVSGGNGGAGGAGTEWDATHGSGGGGGGGAAGIDLNGKGGGGGLYGGGGGGGYSGSGGNGAQGIVVIVYTPLNAPTVTTGSASLIAATSSTLGGTITDTGGSNATARGFASSTNSALTTGAATSTESDSFGTGAFTGSMGGLTGNTTYYYRAYATNSVGTGYGSIESLLTLPNIPGTPSFSAVTETTMTISWSAPTGGAATYKLERCAGSGCSDFVEIQGALASPTFDDSSLSAATVYRYRVRATNATGDGLYSTPAEQVTDSTPTAENPRVIRLKSGTRLKGGVRLR